MIDPLDPRTLEPARRAANVSRAELAALARVNETTILRIEKGDTDPRIDGTWAPIVRALRAIPQQTAASCEAKAAAHDEIDTVAEQQPSSGKAERSFRSVRT